jgi:hypothetical protein
MSCHIFGHLAALPEHAPAANILDDRIEWPMFRKPCGLLASRRLDRELSALLSRCRGKVHAKPTN